MAELVDVVMPDGTTIKDVPSDISREEIMRRFNAMQEPQPERNTVFETLRGQGIGGIGPGGELLPRFGGIRDTGDRGRGFGVDEPPRVGGFLDALGGTGESALSLLTGAAAAPVSGLAGIFNVQNRDGTGPTPADRVEQVQNALTFKPRSEAGQTITEGLGEVIEPIDTAATDLFDTGNPTLSALLKAGVLGAPEALLGRSIIKSSVAGGTPGQFIPSVKELFSAGRVAFNEAHIRGGGIRPNALQRIADRIRTIRNDRGIRIDFDEILHPQATRIRQRLLDDLESGQVDFDEMMTLRELASDVAGSPEPAQSMRGMRLRNEIDDFVDALKPSDVISGNPQQASQALNAARQFWHDASKARTIEREMNLAGINANTFHGAGYENALRIQFKQLSRRIERGTERGFNAAEIAAIRRVANGSPVGNLLRTLGKNAPTGVVSTVGAGAVGNFFGGPIGAVALPAAGLVGRQLATRATLRNAQKAQELPLKNSLLNP